MTLQSMLTISLLLFLSLDNLLAFSTRSLSHSLRPTSSNVQQSSASLRRRASQSPAPVVASAATTADLVNEGDAFESSSADSKPSFPVVLWRFTRPHTIIGMCTSVLHYSLKYTSNIKLTLNTHIFRLRFGHSSASHARCPITHGLFSTNCLTFHCILYSTISAHELVHYWTQSNYRCRD